jgi:hypothetical protein
MVDWFIKLSSASGMMVLTFKVLAWMLHPTIVAADAAIIRPAMVRIDTLSVIVARQERMLELHEKSDEDAAAGMRTVIEMLAYPPGSQEREKRARAFLKAH